MPCLVALFLLACRSASPTVEPATDTDAATATQVDSGLPFDTAVDWCAEVQAIVDARCVACHGTARTYAGLSLTDVSVAVDRVSGQAPLVLIEPGLPAQSYLLHKVDGTHRTVGGSGGRMPPSTANALTSVERRALTAWIRSGAGCGG